MIVSIAAVRLRVIVIFIIRLILFLDSVGECFVIWIVVVLSDGVLFMTIFQHAVKIVYIEDHLLGSVRLEVSQIDDRTDQVDRALLEVMIDVLRDHKIGLPLPRNARLRVIELDCDLVPQDAIAGVALQTQRLLRLFLQHQLSQLLAGKFRGL